MNQNQTETLSLTNLEAEQVIQHDDTLPHYAMSYLLEIPMYEFTGTKSFAKFEMKLPAGEIVLLNKIQPFQLIPINNLVVDGPPEYIATAMPDRDNPESFNPKAVTVGLTRKFSHTARQNIRKLTESYGRFGVFEHQSLTGRPDAQRLCDIVLPINDLSLFPRLTRSYRATDRTAVFTDQVSKYLREKARFQIEKAPITDEQRKAAFALYAEMVNYTERSMNFAKAALNEIVNDIAKARRTSFSFNKESADGVYPLDFMILANLNQPEPDVSANPALRQSQAAPVQDNSGILAELAKSQVMMTQMFGMMMQNGMQMPTGFVPPTPAPPIAQTETDEYESSVTADGIGALDNLPVSETNQEPENSETGETSELEDELFGNEKTADETEATFGERMAEARRRKKAEKEAATLAAQPS